VPKELKEQAEAAAKLAIEEASKWWAFLYHLESNCLCFHIKQLSLVNSSMDKILFFGSAYQIFVKWRNVLNLQKVHS
jgi:hypothetical protein